MDECDDDANSIDPMEHDIDVDVEPELSVSAMQEMYSPELQQSVLKYSVKLREKYLLSAATHADIVADCKSLINSVLTCHGNVVRTHLNSTGYNVSEDKTLVDSVLDTNMYDSLWSDCDSSYKLEQNCHKLLGMIKPVEHIAGEFKSYYVPLTNVLKMLVQKEDIAPYVLKETFKDDDDDDHLTSFTSGSAFMSLASCKKDGHLLLIHLYNDEFDVVNPIGPKRGKHKLNATYFTLGNLPAKFRSSLKHIHLINLVKHVAVKDHGYYAVFEPLIQELQKLYTDGFTAMLPGGYEARFYVVLCTVSGDNLSSNALAGFRQVFNSGHFCRVCMIDYSEISTKTSSCTLRNAALHLYHLEEVKQNPENSAVYGVKGPSVFASLEYFDVTQAFPPDVMHDCMEGVMPSVTSAVVKYLVAHKVTTVAKLNSALDSFVFLGSDKTNKPEHIRKDCSIVGSAAQKFCLFRFLPFFVDIEVCASVLKLYILAREVMSYALCRCIARTDLDYFEHKIDRLHQCIRDSFPDITITPKFHFLAHYPLMMGRYGPLRNMWCMRYESKHQYFKSVAQTVGNFINIAQTLSNRHQMLQCYLFSEKHVLQEELELPSYGKSVYMTSLPVPVQQCLCYASPTLWSVKEVTTASCKFQVGASVVVDFTSDGDPVFIEIQHILQSHQGHVDVVGKLLIPVAFNCTYFCYEVRCSGWAHFHPGFEKDCSLLWAYEVNGCRYISLPYHIPTWSSSDK